MIAVPAAGRPRAVGGARSGSGRGEAAGGGPQADGPRRVRQAGWPQAKPAELAEAVPADGLQLHAPLERRRRRRLEVTVDGSRVVAAAGGRAGRPATSPQALQGHAAGVTLELPDAGRLRKGSGLLFRRLGQAAQGRQQRRVVRPHGRPARLSRLGPVVENGRLGTHIVHKWPDDALKVVANDPFRPSHGPTCW